MTNHREILHLKALGLTNTAIATSCGCGRNTVTRVLERARVIQMDWAVAEALTVQQVTDRFFVATRTASNFKRPDYQWVHQEMQKSGVTLSLLWVEYCEQCRQAGDTPYQSTQFNKYYADYAHKTKATMHLDHKPGQTMQVDWAGHWEPHSGPCCTVFICPQGGTAGV